MPTAAFKILVDADAFPGVMRDILFRAAARLEVPVVLLAGQYQRPPESPLIACERVEAGPDAVDDRIVELVAPGDLVITADIPLADRIVTRGGTALTFRGELLTARNVKSRLATRDLLADLRDNGVVGGGPAALHAGHRQAFANELDRFLTRQVKRRHGDGFTK